MPRTPKKTWCRECEEALCAACDSCPSGYEHSWAYTSLCDTCDGSGGEGIDCVCPECNGTGVV